MNNSEDVAEFEKFKLPQYATISDTELVAILKSLSKAITIPDKTSFSLYSDSLSSLTAIENPDNANPLVFKIKETH